MLWRSWSVGLLITGILLVAAWFRLYDITHYPPGLFPDQAANGEDALLILQGDIRPFYARNNGREALFLYFQAAAIALFGIGVWPMFATSAVMGIATVGAVYVATRAWWGRSAAALAACFLATSYWHTTLSRTGFRAIMVALCVALTTALVGLTWQAVERGQRRRSYMYAILAGIAFASGFYTYIAYRIMVAVMAMVVLIILTAALHPQVQLVDYRRWWRHVVLASVTCLLTLVPLGWYFVQHPASVVGRANQVSIFDPQLQRQFGDGQLLPTLAYTISTTALSFFVGPGDSNWRHSVAGFALVNPLVAMLGLIGVAWTAQRASLSSGRLSRGRAGVPDLWPIYVLLLLGALAVPVVTTAEGLPHALRSVGLVVPIFILAGQGGAFIWRTVHQRSSPALRPWLAGFALGLLAVSAVYDGTLYFILARRTPAAYSAYRGDLTVAARYLNQPAVAQTRPYVVLDGFSLQTIHFLTSVTAHDDSNPHPDVTQHKWRHVEPEQSGAIVLQPGEMMVFTQSTMAQATRYGEQHAETVVVAREYNWFGEEVLRVYAGVGEPGPARTEHSLDA